MLKTSVKEGLKKLYDIKQKLSKLQSKRFDAELKLSRYATDKNIVDMTKPQRKKLLRLQTELEELSNSMKPLIEERHYIEKDMDRDFTYFSDAIFYHDEIDQYFLLSTIDGYIEFSEVRMVE